jgi:hypothetical protein
MIEQDLQQDELIGVVRNHSQWRFFAGTLAEWILDYTSYDPSYDPSKWSYVYRGNLLKVDEHVADEFCRVMEVREFFPIDIQRLVKNHGSDKIPLTILVDFDERVFINGFYDLAIENYAPAGWKAYFGSPLDYVPEEIRSLWKHE